MRNDGKNGEKWQMNNPNFDNLIFFDFFFEYTLWRNEEILIN